MATQQPALHDHEEEEDWAARKWKREPDWMYLTPIAVGASVALSTTIVAYADLLFFSARLIFRKNDKWRNRAFIVVVGAGLLHGGWLMCVSAL